MTDNEFTKILTKAAKPSYEHSQLRDKIADECIKRFGVDFGEADCDPVIDIIDYGRCDRITAKDADYHMLTYSNIERIN